MMVRMLENVKVAEKKACEFFWNLSGRFWGCSWGRARLSIEIQVGNVRSSLNSFGLFLTTGTVLNWCLKNFYLDNDISSTNVVRRLFFITGLKTLLVLNISRSLILPYTVVGLSNPLKIRENRRKTKIPVTIFDVLTYIFCFLTSIFLFYANFYAVWKKSLFDLVKKWRFYDG